MSRGWVAVLLVAPVHALPPSFPGVSPALSPALSRLSAREREVLHALGRGRSNQEIARSLYVAEATVKSHVASVLRKLDLRDRTHAAVFAYESGLIRPGEPDPREAEEGPITVSSARPPSTASSPTGPRSPRSRGPSLRIVSPAGASGPGGSATG